MIFFLTKKHSNPLYYTFAHKYPLYMYVHYLTNNSSFQSTNIANDHDINIYIPKYCVYSVLNSFDKVLMH